MIAPQLVDEVRRLLAEEMLSQRKIARHLGISRGTVGVIANGKRPDYSARPPARRDDTFAKPTGPPERCPGCGRLVHMSCLACRTQAANVHGAARPLLPAMAQLETPLGLELRDSHRERYRQIHLRKLREDRPTKAPKPYSEPPNDDELCELDPDKVLDAFELDE